MLADLLARVRPFGAPVIAVVFDIPLPVCLRRNAARRRPGPEDVVRAHHAQMIASRPRLLDEGFARVHTIHHRAHTAELAAVDDENADAPTRQGVRKENRQP